MNRQIAGLALLATIVCLISTEAQGQITMTGVNPPGTTALEDVSGGALASRSPGNMVQAGVARHNEFQSFDFGITETPPAITPFKAAMVAVLAAFFEELNVAIDAFTALLIARAGDDSTSALSNLFSDSFE